MPCSAFGGSTAFTPQDKGLVFKALTHLERLRTLVLPELNDFLPTGLVVNLVTPLKDLPALRRVRLRARDRQALQSKAGTQLCSQINFEAMQDAGCTCPRGL